MTQTKNSEEYVYQYHWGRIISALLLLAALLFGAYWLISQQFFSEDNSSTAPLGTHEPEQSPISTPKPAVVANDLQQTTRPDTAPSSANNATTKNSPTIKASADKITTAKANIETPKIKKQATPVVSAPTTANKQPVASSQQPITEPATTQKAGNSAEKLKVASSGDLRTQAKRFTDAIERAKLTYKVTHLEPGKAAAKNLRITGKALEKVYFFTEVKGQAGETHYHSWYRNGKLEAKVPIVIKGNRWRCYSSKYLDRHHTGEWEVKITNSKGTLLATSHFSVNQ